MAKYATEITSKSADRIEAVVRLAAYSMASADPLAVRLCWTARSGWATPASLDGCVAERWAQRGYVAAGKRVINSVRDAA